MADEPKTYTGWKAGLAVVFAVIAMVAVLNLAGEALQPDREPKPGKVVTTVRPTG